ncbi:MAG: HAD family phosphatase [Cyclobacteriaceae bacterium]|nr:HAD family phosphatase [Cyclobacteriaceae bacterium]UYN85711.1 MAG: HAD family phosphatase [Cyclobacteriaceae bacterium]
MIPRNLIFDLGGVIIDLSVERTIQSICDLSGVRPDQVRHAYRTHTEFYAYERGEITDAEFRQVLQRIFSFSAPDEQIDSAWNAMLVQLPVAKLQLLDRLKKRFSVAVLSNTNNIHLSFVNQSMLPQVDAFSSLNDYFHVHYYSHLVGKRKPESQIFTQVLDENNYVPEQTLFLDDNKENIEAAAALGIQTFLVEHPDRVLDYFRNYE